MNDTTNTFVDSIAGQMAMLKGQATSDANKPERSARKSKKQSVEEESDYESGTDEDEESDRSYTLVKLLSPSFDAAILGHQSRHGPATSLGLYEADPAHLTITIALSTSLWFLDGPSHVRITVTSTMAHEFIFTCGRADVRLRSLVSRARVPARLLRGLPQIIRDMIHWRYTRCHTEYSAGDIRQVGITADGSFSFHRHSASHPHRRGSIPPDTTIPSPFLRTSTSLYKIQVDHPIILSSYHTYLYDDNRRLTALSFLLIVLFLHHSKTSIPAKPCICILLGPPEILLYRKTLTQTSVAQ
nr:hypothetical protein CFP56_31017 [Quercus suber]